MFTTAFAVLFSLSRILGVLVADFHRDQGSFQRQGAREQNIGIKIDFTIEITI